MAKTPLALTLYNVVFIHKLTNDIENTVLLVI